MNIVICDDDGRFICSLDNYLRTYLATNNIPFTIKHHISGESLLSSIGQIDLVFLDIQMADLNGIEVASILRRKNPNFILIFVSSYVEYAPSGYEVKAFRYILKDQLKSLFDITMDAILHEMGFFRTEITLDFVYGAETIFTENLIYIESKLHTLYFYFNGDKERRHLYGKLDGIQKILPSDDFIRIHKSYLVNISYLLNVKNYTAFLKNDTKLPISQNKFTETKKRLFLYRGKL